MRIDVGRNAKRNIFLGLINKIILMVLPFVMRSVIFSVLGVEYLGLNSLFASILQMLVLSDLGFSSALVYNMYKPIAENDTEKLNALLNLYRGAYKIIGIVIMAIGVILIPFLPYLVNGSYPDGINVVVIYLIQLVNTSISYFLFGYRQSLLVAYQREDINYLINLVIQVCLQSLQIGLLIALHNYYVYVICMPFFTVASNLWIGIATKRLYPKLKPEGKLDKETLVSIKKLVTGTFIQRACSVTRNSLDSICLSAFVGLTITGMYNNYYTVLHGVTIAMGVVSTSLSGGIGNHVAIKSKEENFEELRRIDFLYMTISGWCTVCLLCLYQPFVRLWMGESMLLSFGVVILLCVYFYALKLGDMLTLYSSANGLWWKNRYRAVCETICNVILNISLGKLFGIYGIILATIISLILCNFMWGARIIFKNYFKGDLIKRYYKYHTGYAVMTLLVCGITYFACNCISVSLPIIKLLLNGVLCAVIPGIIFFVVYRKNSICTDSIKMILRRKK